MGAGPGAEGGGHLAWTQDWREGGRPPKLRGGGGGCLMLLTGAVHAEHLRTAEELHEYA